jgi:tetratricopeptide (TPR) repeat protein
LTVLGRHCGLDLGVVEVVIDTRGQNVPHTAVLVRLDGGQPRVVDLWYGSSDIHHKKLGLRVWRGGRWRIADLDLLAFKKSRVTYLPDRAVNGITLYVEGNRSLKQGDYLRAVAQYTQAARLYPSNARIYYNRAIARENLGQPERAEADYARALRDSPALTRTLAVQSAEVVDLIKLDENRFPEHTQRIYLAARGFITGRRTSINLLSRQFALSPAAVTRLLNHAETAFK